MSTCAAHSASHDASGSLLSRIATSTVAFSRNSMSPARISRTRPRAASPQRQQGRAGTHSPARRLDRAAVRRASRRGRLTTSAMTRFGVSGHGSRRDSLLCGSRRVLAGAADCDPGSDAAALGRKRDRPERSALGLPAPDGQVVVLPRLAVALWWRRVADGTAVGSIGEIHPRLSWGQAKAQVLVPVLRLVPVPVRAPHVLRAVPPASAPVRPVRGR